MPRPICFMVMPYGARATGAERADAPAQVDFNALWDKAYGPVLEELGYDPVRADQDTGALIIKEMIERLALSDLVLADITVQNANVYYEVGIRHAARNTGCVLVAADWSRQPFDLDQMPNVRYALPDGTVPDDAAATIRDQLRQAIPTLRDAESPVTQSVPGFPTDVDPAHATSFRKFTREMAGFQARIKGIRGGPPSQRRERAAALLGEYPAAKVLSAAVAVELVHLARDHVGWPETAGYIGNLPEGLRAAPYMQEQLALARSKSGDHQEAVDALEALIQQSGGTSERYGLLGGRFKKLYDTATNEGDKAHYLGKSIDSYEQGMQCDLNDYYPICNLARLYRARGAADDEAKAQGALSATIAACRRALARNTQDEWVRPTLLGAAFDKGDAVEAKRLLGEVRAAGATAWKLDTTLDDLERSAAQCPDAADRAILEEVAGALRGLLPPSAGG